MPRSPQAFIEQQLKRVGRLNSPSDAASLIELSWWSTSLAALAPSTHLGLRRAIAQLSAQGLKIERLRSSLMSELSAVLKHTQRPELMKARQRLLEAAIRVTEQPSPYEERLFPKRPTLPDMSAEVMSLYFLKARGEVYRLTQQGAELIELKRLGKTQTISAQIKAWRAALSERPTPWPGGARRDPQAKL